MNFHDSAQLVDTDYETKTASSVLSFMTKTDYKLGCESEVSKEEKRGD